MAAGVTTREKERQKILRDYIDKAKKFEDDKEYATLQLAKYLFEIKANNAHHIIKGYPDGTDGFKMFCGEFLNIGYHTAMRYIAIYKMVVDCAIDPAVAEDLGYSKLRAITGITRPDNVEYILEQAKKLNTNELEEFVKKYKKQMEEGTAPTSGEDNADKILAKRFVFPASEEEVEIINNTLIDVRGLLNTANDTTALTHIFQGYMEFVYPIERDKAIEDMKQTRKENLEKKAAKQQAVVVPETSPEVKPEPVIPEVMDSDIITEGDIPTATLPQLVAFAEATGIELDVKIASNKAKVKAAIVDALAAEGGEEPTEAPVIDITPEPEVKEDAKVSPEKAKKPKADKADKKPKVEKKEVEPEPEIADPANVDDEADNLTIEAAMAEIRNVSNKNELKEVAKSWGVTIPKKEFDKTDVEVLIEMVAKAVCDANDEPYIPPQDDDTSDLDAMMNGE